jgi:hypothetical protein
MLVYGDHSRRVSTRGTLDGIAKSLQRLAGMPPGIERHGELVAIFIETGEAAQGIADAEFEARGCDARGPSQDAAMALLDQLAGAIRLSWEGSFTESGRIPLDFIERLAAFPQPERLIMRRPEGYAFYAVYPEAYLEAAKAVANVSPLRVIGIRSIGTGLAALVAAATGADNAFTVRPTGDPFRRNLKLSLELAAELVRDPAASFAIVDEGPGLSGSSFGAVADFLEGTGVRPDRIHFFPSHGGDLGSAGDVRHRERWRGAARHVVDFDDLVLRAADPAHRLESWVADLTRVAEGPIEDISGGAWRRLHFANEADWPPSHIQQERRKFLLRAGGGTWLLKFAGLGREGSRKLELARQLHAAGFVPEPAGWRHGFLVERWIEQAGPLRLQDVDRAALVERLAAYIGFRAIMFPAEQGASLEQLLAMARRNTALGLSESLAERLGAWQRDLAALQSQVRAVRTDNRLHAWEWLQMPDGRLLKTDALDHHAAHDLIGCQDVTWDVAGATVEFALSDNETAGLCRIIERITHRPVHPRLLAFSAIGYAAFQLGYWSLAADALVGCPEADRTRAAAGAYARTLERLLEAG